jgi:hypothetical protein
VISEARAALAIHISKALTIGGKDATACLLVTSSPERTMSIAQPNLIICSSIKAFHDEEPA